MSQIRRYSWAEPTERLELEIQPDTLSTHRCVGGKGVDKDIIERDILGTDEEVGPAGRVELGDTLNRHASSVVSYK